MRVKKHAMNKFLRTCIFLGAFLVVGCSDESREDIMPTSEVVFDTMLPEGWNPITHARAGIVGDTELQELGFGVFAYYTEDELWANANAATPNFMNNTQVYSTDNGTSWTYSPIKYWPNNEDDKVSFFAYAPYVGTLTATDSKLNYISPTDVDNQVDLMWSNSTTTDLQKGTVGDKVHFDFRHALSRIGFTVEAKIDGKSPIDEYEKVVMEVKKIVLTSTSDYTGTGTGSFYRQASLEMNNQTENARWTYDDNSETQRYTLSESDLLSHMLVLNKSNNSSASSQPLTSDDNCLMIIPQDFSAEGFHVYVEYDVDLYFSGNGTSSEHQYFTYTNGCVGNLKIEFEPAKSYIINIQLGLKDAVLGEVSITDWGEEEIELPKLVD